MTVSRSKILAAGSALTVFGPAVIAAMVQAAEAADEGDIKILNTAIPLELAAIKAYTDAAGLNLLQPAVLQVAVGFRTDHQAHADALAAAVRAAGATPVTTPVAITYPALKSQADILKFAESLERQAASTYLSVIPVLKDRNLAKTMASILGVETTHVSTLAAALGEGKAYTGFVS
jgi:rubrerythrin